MTSGSARPFGGAAALSGLLAVAGVTGCGGSMDLGPTVRVPADQRQVVEASSIGKQVSLPKDQPFNIHVKQSTQNPGANGTAQGAADANGWGEASCSAMVAEGGAATGECRIGQAIDYRGDVPLKVAVKVSLKLNHELGAEPVTPGTIAQLALTASVRDSAGLVNPRIAIESLSSDDAPGKGTRSDDREFSFVMEPGHSYQIILDGGVNAASDARAKAFAKMNISNLRITMDFLSAASPMPATAPAAK